MQPVKGEMMMPDDKIYEETIPSLIGKLVFVLMIGISLLFLFLFIYQMVNGALGSRPAPDWFYLVMFVLFAGVSYLVSNFRSLKTDINSQGVSIAYGSIKHNVWWDNIRGCYLDAGSGMNYGGWGIRLGRAEGRWILVYNIVNAPRVVLELDRGRFGRFVFSTRNPEEVMNLVHQQIRK